MEKFRFLWSSNSKFSIFPEILPRVWYRAIFYCSVSIEFGSKHASESQTLFIPSNNLLLCIIYSSILYSEQSTEQCTHCALVATLSVEAAMSFSHIMAESFFKPWPGAGCSADSPGNLEFEFTLWLYWDFKTALCGYARLLSLIYSWGGGCNIAE